MELEGDANCCPSVTQERVLRIENGSAVWQTLYGPGELRSELGCWQAAHLLAEEHTRFVDTDALGSKRGAIRKRLFECSRNPEEESARVKQHGRGLLIQLDEGSLEFNWSVKTESWVVDWRE
jgi:hypothetical protein